MKRPPFSRGRDDEEREPSWYEQLKESYKEDSYDRFRPRHEQIQVLERMDFTETTSDYTKKVVEPAVKKVCEDTGIRHVPNEGDLRRNLDNPDYYVRDWDIDEFNELPFYDALNLYKKFCKKYLIDMRMFKRPRKERRREVFAQVLETNQDLNSFVEDNDRLIEQRHQEIKYRFEKVIPKLWDALTSRAEFAALEETKAKRFKSWEKTNFDENDEALRRRRDYLKIPPTVMQRQDVHGPSVLELVKTPKGMRKVLKEGHPYTKPDLKRLRRVHKGKRSVGKILGLLEGEVTDREEEIKEFDLEQEPYNQLTEQEMRALYAWGKDGKNERTQKWRRSLQRRIRKVTDGEVLERRQSQISTSSLDTVPSPGELFAQMEEQLLAREKQEKEEEEARAKRPGGVLRSLLDMAGSDSDSDEEGEREPRKAQLPVSRPALKVSPLEDGKKNDLEEKLRANGVLPGEEEDRDKDEDAKDGNEEAQNENVSGWLGAPTEITGSGSLEDEDRSTNGLSQFSEEFGSYGSEDGDHEEGTAVEKKEEGEVENELQTGVGSVTGSEDLGLLAPVGREEEDAEESKSKELHGEVEVGGSTLLQEELAPLAPVENGEEDQEERREDQEEDQNRRTSMLERLGAFVSGYRRKSSRTISKDQDVEEEKEKETSPVLIQARQAEEEAVQLRRPHAEGSVLSRKEGARVPSGPVFIRPKASTRRARMPTAAGEIGDSKEAPSNVLTSERIFELAAQGKIAESSHTLLESWDGHVEWDAHLQDLGFIRRADYQNEDVLKARFGKHRRIVKLLSDLSERKFANEETLDMAEEAQLLTHNGKEMEKIFKFELALASPRGKHTPGETVASAVVKDDLKEDYLEQSEHKETEEEEGLLDKKQVESDQEEDDEEEEEEEEEEKVEVKEVTGGASNVLDSSELGTGVIPAVKTEESEEGTVLEKQLDPTVEYEARDEDEEKSEEPEAMPPPKPRLETSETVGSGAFVAATQLEPPGTSVSVSEQIEEARQDTTKTGSNNLGDDVSSDVSLIHAARSFELGLLGKLAREGSALLEATEWKENVQWDEYFDNMKLWRVKDLKDRNKVADRFKKEASVINALVLICEKAMDNPEGVTHSQRAILNTHNGREMTNVFEFDKTFEEFLNGRGG